MVRQITKKSHSRGSMQALMLVILTTTASCKLLVGATKVIDFNENLPDLIEKYGEKNWLIKFYAPWCYHCQKLEPTFNNVAESIYNRHENLVVGRVDCTRWERICEQFGVKSFPFISYINQQNQVPYRGDRSEASILAFADRLQGPTINVVHSCEELRKAIEQHGLIILSTLDDANNIRQEFESLAQVYKSTHWFYQYSGIEWCENFIESEGLYLLKRHLNRSIKFETRPMSLLDDAPHEIDTLEDDNRLQLRNDIVGWLNRESFSIYAHVSFGNIERVIATGKLLVISILDEYKPAQRFAPSSMEFYRRFKQLASDYSQADVRNELMFGWCSDLELINYIAISLTNPVIPNVIIIKPDYSYHLMMSNESEYRLGDLDGSKFDDEQLLEKLSEDSIRLVIDEARLGKLNFSGGKTYSLIVMRYIMGYVNKFLNMFRANPFLVLVIFGFPSLMISFVIYTTCFSGPHEHEDDDEGYFDGNEFSEDDDKSDAPLQADHLKQE